MLLNAGAALYICGISRNIGDGYLRARQSLESGEARATLALIRGGSAAAQPGGGRGGSQSGCERPEGERGMTIVEQIVSRRRERVAREGHWLSARAREARGVPTVSFGAEPFLVCEVKRRSPSRGDIAPDVDVVEQARAYARAGVRSVSVLTEEDSFSGSLDDLGRIKNALPEVAVLRKDFLLDEEDIEVSWRAGADAVLLIASILDAKTLAALHAAAERRGLTALVEVHDAGDVAKCRDILPSPCRDQLPRPFHFHRGPCSSPLGEAIHRLEGAPGIRVRNPRA